MSDEQKSKVLAKFTEWFEEFSTYILRSFPDPLDPKEGTFTELLTMSIQKLTLVEKAMSVFIRWIRARKDAYSSAKSFADTLRRVSREKSDFSTKITLFVIPLFSEMLKAVDVDLKYNSKVKPFLPTISKISEGSSAGRQRLEGLRVLGVNPRGFASHVEDYFGAVADGRLDEASKIFEGIRANFENLKQNLKKSRG